MEGTPDISKVVGIIMENPELIERISAMMKDGDTPNEEKNEVEQTGRIETPAEEASTKALPTSAEAKRHNRTRLLGAMKPYLNESRVKAIDTMIGIVDALDMMRGR